MKRIVLIGAALVWLCATTAIAQDVLSVNIRIYSKDNSHYVYLSEKSVGTKEVQMYKADQTEPLWSAWIDWRKSSYGFTTNDGSTFIVVDTEYSELSSPIIVYSKNAPQAYAAETLPIAKEYLRLEAAKYYWIDPIPTNFIVNYTADGNALTMDIRMLNEKRIRIRLPK